jgi:hypothetical protein
MHHQGLAKLAIFLVGIASAVPGTWTSASYVTRTLTKLPVDKRAAQLDYLAVRDAAADPGIAYDATKFEERGIAYDAAKFEERGIAYDPAKFDKRGIAYVAKTFERGIPYDDAKFNAKRAPEELMYVNSKREAEPEELMYVNSKRDASPEELMYVNSK